MQLSSLMSRENRSSSAQKSPERLALIGLMIALLLSALTRFALTHVQIGWQAVRSEVVSVKVNNALQYSVIVASDGVAYKVEDASFGWSAEEGTTITTYLSDGKMYAEQGKVLSASPLTFVWNLMLGIDAICALAVLFVHHRARKARAKLGGLMSYTTAIFDMDGTILDTIRDMTFSLNLAMEATEHKHDFTVDDVRTFFGSGATVAITRALAAEKSVPAETRSRIGQGVSADDIGVKTREVERVEDAFSSAYARHSTDSTRPYEGIAPLLSSLRECEVKCAVVSNKMDSQVKRLAEKHFPGLLDIAVGVRPDIRRKPAPDTVLHVMSEYEVTPEQAVYVGDSEIDILTAQAAGIDCISVTWGFRDRAFLEAHGATQIADDANELATLILG